MTRGGDVAVAARLTDEAKNARLSLAAAEDPALELGEDVVGGGVCERHDGRRTADNGCIIGFVFRENFKLNFKLTYYVGRGSHLIIMSRRNDHWSEHERASGAVSELPGACGTGEGVPMAAASAQCI